MGLSITNFDELDEIYLLDEWMSRALKTFHRQSTIAHFNISKPGGPSGGGTSGGGGGNIITTMEPRMNQYAAMREPIGTPAVYSTIGRDYYLSIMNLQGDQAGVLIINMPMVGWIWGAVLLMGAGGLIALIPARKRMYIVVPESAPTIDDEAIA